MAIKRHKPEESVAKLRQVEVLVGQGMSRIDPALRRPAPASRPGLQPRQLHADAGLAEGDRALVIDDAAGEAGQDRRQGREPRPLCHVPTGRGGGAEGTVPGYPEPDR